MQRVGVFAPSVLLRSAVWQRPLLRRVLARSYSSLLTASTTLRLTRHALRIAATPTTTSTALATPFQTVTAKPGPWSLVPARALSSGVTPPTSTSQSTAAATTAAPATATATTVAADVSAEPKPKGIRAIWRRYRYPWLLGYTALYVGTFSSGVLGAIAAPDQVSAALMWCAETWTSWFPDSHMITSVKALTSPPADGGAAVPNWYVNAGVGWAVAEIVEPLRIAVSIWWAPRLERWLLSKRWYANSWFNKQQPAATAAASAPADATGVAPAAPAAADSTTTTASTKPRE